MARGALLLQLVLPGAIARYLPVLLSDSSTSFCLFLDSNVLNDMCLCRFGHHLEDAVLRSLLPVVAAIVMGSFTLALLILRSTDQSIVKQLSAGGLGLVLGALLFHVIVVLFGAPVVDLMRHTFLLAVLLSSCVTLPLALHFGCAPRQWLDLLLDLRMRNLQEQYLVCSSIGAMIGAYVGALPIPLDWDRPWQQWPLTCVYGTLIGHASGILVSIVLSTTSSSFDTEENKED